MASLGAPLLVSAAPALRGAPPARQLSHFPGSPHFLNFLANCPHEPIIVHLRTEAYGSEVSWEIVPEMGHDIENYWDHHNHHHQERQSGDEVRRKSVPQIGHHFEYHANQPAPQMDESYEIHHHTNNHQDGRAEAVCEGVGEEDRYNYHTACCVPAGNYRLVCSSSHGYGWHGGTLTINEVDFCGDHGDNGDHDWLHDGHHLEVALHIGERASTETITTTPHTTTETATTTTTTTPTRPLRPTPRRPRPRSTPLRPQPPRRPTHARTSPGGSTLPAPSSTAHGTPAQSSSSMGSAAGRMGTCSRATARPPTRRAAYAASCSAPRRRQRSRRRIAPCTRSTSR